MPTSPPRWCPRCQAPHPAACPAKPTRIEVRPDATRRQYDSRWQKIRAVKRSRDPLCEWCKANGIVRLAEMVDHYVPLACGGTSQDDNLVSMCNRCHAQKTQADYRKYPQVYKK